MQNHQNIEAVAVGASAGGVEALILLLDALPADFAPAVFIVLHLPKGRESMLPQLFSRRCALSVKEAEDNEAIKAGTVYLAPADYHLLIEPEKSLSLSLDEPQHYSRPSIDLLFESAAYAYRERLLGIILTGASMDGASGLQTVRALGGLAWVQDPDEAIASAMPAAAISLAGADHVLPVKEIAAKLSSIRNV